MSAEAVKVIVRCRPFNEREEKLACRPVISMDPSIGQVQLAKPNADDSSPPKLFSFDGVYFMQDHTKQIYEEICFPLVESVLEGFNGTIFAYGQTGCGKSYTMMGVEDDENRGIIPRVFYHVFEEIAVSESTKYLVRASYLEIYNEEIRDLLTSQQGTKVTRLELHEHPEKGVYVEGLSHHKVVNTKDLERIMELGSRNRSVGATAMNAESSRSHSIFTIDLEMMDVVDGEEKVRAGRLNLVDLAGSERQSKTEATGVRLREATKINLSLSALGNVISALVDGKSKHIPYRDSKLTRLLQSSLGGNTKTLMVACVSPADNNYEETLSTLRYANRAKNIKNKPKINEDPKDALLRQYQDEIQKLKMMLVGQGGLPVEATEKKEKSQYQIDMEAIEAEKEAIRREYEGRLSELRSQYMEEQSGRTRLQNDLLRVQQEYEERLAEAAAQATAMAAGQSEGTMAAGQSEGTMAAGQSEGTMMGGQSEGTMMVGQSEGTMMGGSAQESFSIGTDTEELHGQDQGAQAMPPPLVGGPDALLGGSPTRAAGDLTPEKGGMPFGSDGHKGPSAPPLDDRAPPLDDRVILLEHEDALRKLEALQKEMIGGEKAGNNALKASLKERRNKADDRTLQLKKANEQLMDDDGIIERIFNSLTDEVRVKTQLLERTQAKYRSAEEDIKDLGAEFELERQDFLDTIRKLQQTIKLQEQLLDTVVPCLRRDCNYYNIDRVKSEAIWNEEEGRWALPQFTVTKTSLSSLSPVDSKASLVKPSSKTPRTEAPSNGGLAPNGALLAPSKGGAPTEDKFLQQLQKGEEASYFKPRRAMELLGGRASLGPGGEQGGAPTAPLLTTAAAIHGVETQIMTDPAYSRRPSKLQALPVSVSQSISPRNEQEDLLEKMERKMNTRKKQNLQPLLGTRRPPA